MTLAQDQIQTIRASIARHERTYLPIGKFQSKTKSEGLCPVCGSWATTRAQHKTVILCLDCSKVHSELTSS